MATLKDVKDFFEYDSSTNFQKDWKELDQSDKDWFKNEIEQEKESN